MKTNMKRFFGILLTLALVLGLLPGMSLTVYADDDPYASIKNTTTVVHFDSKDWYLIDYDSSTVTLLAKECVSASRYNSSGSFVDYSSNPTVKSAVDTYYNSISESGKTAVDGNGMFLLTKDQANAITNADVRKCPQFTGINHNYWWLCSKGAGNSYADYVNGDSGNVDVNGFEVLYELGVRPALKLDLSKVTFDSDTKTFSVGSPTSFYTVTYKVVGGTWSDGTTADKTETVASGSKPASVPIGMKPSSGYTGGAWDTNPADTTITGATTFTYTFTAGPAPGPVPGTGYTVTVYPGPNGAPGSNGAADVSQTYAAPGTVITVTVAPDSGYQLSSIYWTADGGATKNDITEAKSFVMPAADVEVHASFQAAPEDSGGGGGDWGGGYYVAPRQAYRLILNQPIEHGSAVLAVSNGKTTTEMGVYANSKVEVYTTPDDGYTLDKIIWSTLDGTSSYDITEAKSFAMPAMNVKVTVTFRSVAG